VKYLAILGRQPEISIAELEMTDFCTDINRLGGTKKLAVKLDQKPLDYLQSLPDGKITIGVSDYSKGASRATAINEALKLKKILVRHGRSVRVIDGKAAELSTATSLYNGLSGKNTRKIELIKTDDGWYRVIGVQDIDAYAKRDQARPARDAKVGMLPPKLAQILINLCGPLKPGAIVLDPFCGTGVVLQEAILMGYHAYGTDINERMIEYSEKNLKWLVSQKSQNKQGIFQVSVGDATIYNWEKPIDAVACEGYLGKPFSNIPSEIELKEQKGECGRIILAFLKNLTEQIKAGAPVVLAAPAWLRKDGSYKRLEILDEIDKLGYNVNNKSRKGLLYHREKQVVARDILILRKK
jgi:tRNA (guanine10-N2)-dimethyltransferase